MENKTFLIQTISAAHSHKARLVPPSSINTLALVGPRNCDPNVTSVIRPMDPTSIPTTDFVRENQILRTSLSPRGKHLLFYQERIMRFLKLFISISILCTLISPSAPGPPHANFFLLQFKHFPKPTLTAHTPFPPIKGIRKNGKKISIYSWFLFLEAGKNKDKISSLCLPKNQ